MAVSSDTALDGQLTRDTSVTEPWIASPRNDENKKKGRSNDIKNYSSNDENIANETTEKSESSNSLSSENDNTSKPANENVNNGSSKSEENKSPTKQSSFMVAELEPELKENDNGNSNKSPQEKNEEAKPTLVGNMQTIENNSPSVKSNGLCDLGPINDADLDMYDRELFITDEERKAFEYMVEQRKEEIEHDKVKFEKWADSITRRRMFAISRLRKLKKRHGERFKLYGKVQAYVKEVEGVLSSVSSSAKSVLSGNNNSTVQSSKPYSASLSESKQTSRPETKDLKREITGFVNAPGSDKESESIPNCNNGKDSNGFAKEEHPNIVPVQS